MTEPTPVASFRRVTPGIIASARLAMANDVPSTNKSEVALLLKRAAPVLGIDGTTYHVMDILLGLSRAEDWQGAGRPVVAISNAKLAEYTMRSERTVIRCIRRLVEVGIAAYKDSSTGRRFVYRSASGDMITGYGIDFTPARVRFEEIRDAVEAYQRKLKEEVKAKRDVSRLSRAIEDLCHAFPEEAEGLRGEMTSVLSGTLGLMDRAAGIEAIYESTIARLTSSGSNDDMTPEGDNGVSPNINTTPKSIVKNIEKRPRSFEREKFSYGSYAAKTAFEKKPPASPAPRQAPENIGDGYDRNRVQAEVLGSVSIGLLRTACREAQSMTGVQLEDWTALAKSGETFRRMIGLSEAGWLEGQQKVGLHAASAILATVVEKAIRDPQQISQPGGYFRAMVDRAVGGKLNLERSLFGLAGSHYGG